MAKAYPQYTLTKARANTLSVWGLFGLTALLGAAALASRGEAAFPIFGPLAIFLGCLSALVFFHFRERLSYALALLVALITFQGDNFGITLKLDGLAVALLGLLLLATPRVFLRRRSYPLLVPVAGYIASNFAATFVNAPVRDVSLAQSVILGLRALTFYVVVMAMHRHAAQRERVAWYFIWVMVAQTMASLVALVIYPVYPTPLVLFGQNGASSLSVNGFFLEPNLYGVFVLCVLSLLIAMFLYAEQSRRTGFIVLGLFGMVGLILSYTRSTWLGLILVTGCLAVCLARRSTALARHRYMVVAAVLGCFGVYLLATVFLVDAVGFNLDIADRFRSIVDSRSASAEVRTLIWNLALQDWATHPLIGTGPLSFVLINGWLFGSAIQTLHDSGTIGLIFMLWFVLGCAAYTWKAYSRAATSVDRGILLGYFLAQIGLFFTSQFSSFFWGGFTWVLLGVAVGHSQIVLREDAAQVRAQLPLPEAHVS